MTTETPITAETIKSWFHRPGADRCWQIVQFFGGADRLTRQRKIVAEGMTAREAADRLRVEGGDSRQYAVHQSGLVCYTPGGAGQLVAAAEPL